MADQADALREIMSRTSQLKNHDTRIIAVTSGKGGVGKTNFSVNLAISYAKINKKVILLDADLGLANVSIVLGMMPKYTISDVINGDKSIKEVVLNTKYGIDFIAGANGISELANLNKEEKEYFASEILNLSYADLIIIDTGAGISNSVTSFTRIANEVIVVTTPEPTSLTDAYGIIKSIAKDSDAHDKKIYLTVNMVTKREIGEETFKKLHKITKDFLNIDLEYLGSIFYDEGVKDSVYKQNPFVTLNPRGKASFCMKEILNNIENTKIKERGFARLIKKILNN